MKRILSIALALLTLFACCSLSAAEGGIIADGYPLVPETVTYTMLNPSSSGEKWENLYLFQVMEKITGVRFAFSNTPSGEYANRQNLLLASGDIPDVLWNAMDSGMLVTYGVEGGLLLDISALMEEYMPNMTAMLEAWPLARAAVTETNGGIYVLPKVSMTATEGGEVLYVRTDYLKKAGIEKPATIEEMYEAMVALKEADWLPENFEVLLPSKMTIMESYLFPSFGDSVDPEFGADEDGNVTYNKISDQYFRYVEFMNRLFAEGLLCNEIYSMDNSVITSKVKANECAFFTAGTSLSLANFESGTYDVEIVAPMTSEYADTAKVRGILSEKIGGVQISAKAENPEILLKYFDIWYSESDVGVAGFNGISTKFGVYGENWVYMDDAHRFYKRIVPDDTPLTEEEYRINYVAPSSQPPAYAIMTAVASGNPAQEMKGEQCLDNYIPYWVNPFPKNFLKFTSAENEVVSAAMTDIDSYTKNMLAKFITGAEPLENWDAYVQTVEGMDIESVLNAYQAAYDRLLAAMDAQ